MLNINLSSLQRQKLELMKFKSYLLPAFMLMTFLSMQAQEITDNKFGKGLINLTAKDSSYSITLGGTLQFLYSSQWDDSENEGFQSGESNFLIRRTRLNLDGFAYSPKLKYKLQMGFANRDQSAASVYTNKAPGIILDALLKWNFYENFELWAGQTKLPGNREELTSSTSLQTVDRSLLNSNFNVGRDMGFQLHHFFEIGDKFVIKEAVAISQGEGRNVTSGNLGGYQFTGRLDILPFGDFADFKGGDLKRETLPKLSLGVSFDHNKNAVRTRSNAGSYMLNDLGLFETDINTFFLDAIFKFQGISFMGEYANRTSDNAIAINSDGTATGDVVNIGNALNLQAGYLLKSNYEILGRYTNITLDRDITGQEVENQYTLGLSKYIVGHNLKVQTDFGYNDFDNNFTDNLIYRLQFSIHF